MNQAILVPLDGSITAEMVIPYVEEIAAGLKPEIVLASVSESHTPDLAHIYRAYLERLKERVQRGIKDFGCQQELKISRSILMGNPASEILRYAEEVQAGLIVIASRGSSSKGPWLLGNVAAKILRATTHPVLLVRTPPAVAALEQKKIIKKILVPLDSSSLGEAALPWAENLAQALGAEIVLFYIVEAAQIRPVGYELNANPYTTIQNEQQAKEAANVYLTKIEIGMKNRGLNVAKKVDSGAPADRILDFARVNSIDLIAMSTHGQSGIGRWVFGSVTDKVLHAGDTPVLVVRAGKIR